jgi:hypothetical protein
MLLRDRARERGQVLLTVGDVIPITRKRLSGFIPDPAPLAAPVPSRAGGPKSEDGQKFRVAFLSETSPDDIA